VRTPEKKDLRKKKGNSKDIDVFLSLYLVPRGGEGDKRESTFTLIMWSKGKGRKKKEKGV